jgi:hypothetical protein
LLAIFRRDGRRIPLLIEVKSKKKNTLSFQPDYHDRLRRYADQLELPLLVAWKFHLYWILFEFSHLKKVRKNWNISYDHAAKENLLGVLAGDFAYSLQPGAGVHFLYRKGELLETVPDGDGRAEHWKLIGEDIYFTDGTHRRIGNLPGEVQLLLFISNLDETQHHSDTHATISFVAGDPRQGYFAHAALVRLLRGLTPSQQALNWRDFLHESNFPKGVGSFEATVDKALAANVVRNVLHLQPHTWPPFLGDAAEAHRLMQQR